MSIFRRSNPPENLPALPQPTQLDVNAALEMVLVNSVKSAAETASAISTAVVGQLHALTEIQSAIFAQRRRKAVAAKQPRGPRGRFDRKRQPACRLCENANISNPTRQEILDHVNHENPGMNYRERDGAIVVDAHETAVQTDKDGNQVIECEDCASGKEHSHVIQ